MTYTPKPPRTQLFMTVEGAAMYLLRARYRQDDFGEWYGVRDSDNATIHAVIQRRTNGAAIVFDIQAT